MVCSRPWNYDGKRFKAVNNSENGEVGNDTTFKYYQKENIMWGHYQGGKIKKGNLIGTVSNDGILKFSYQHVNQEDEVLTGQCISTPQISSSGKIQLHEHWQWTCRDHSKGTSIIEEI
ncbi:n-acetylglutamate synthase [Fulvivirgaceae bacterium BMA10]|uniref:N-acetylglutamate synthase n=1 Tax=Splendidivirga corallicola TaxID=3051826 RepID=A0ABT8KKG9_9BACT|nr:n-acetylglutamate synthase [Fulvivirgaceae bacterium BMA10]